MRPPARRRTVNGVDVRRLGPADLALALGASVFVLSVTAGIEPSPGERGVDALAVGAMLAACWSLAFRRVATVAVLVVITGALLVYTAREYAGGPIYLTLAVVLYTLGATRDWIHAVVPVGLSVAVMVVGATLMTGGDELTWHLAVFPGWAAAALFLGTASRNRRAYLQGLEDRARSLEESREEEARRRVAEERLRIARDLHDALAHSIATITLQSGVAAHVLDRRPEEAAAALDAIRRTSREAMQELRMTLGVLRSAGDEDDAAAPRAPTPGLARVEALADRAVEAGLPITVRRVGDPGGPLPTAVDVAAYRIVQEAITNVMRHAGPATATVTVTTGREAVEVEVLDDGRGAAANGAGAGTGHGIAGMRERASIVGGTLDAGPRAGGGFRVWARLPLAPGPEERE
jgi:signal transduction histidine kinase